MQTPRETIHRTRVTADTSSLISLGTANVLEKSLAVVEIISPEEVKLELHATAQFADVHGRAASEALRLIETGQIVVCSLASSYQMDILCEQYRRLDRGEAAVILLAEQERTEAVLCDDFKAWSQMSQATDKQIYLSVYAISRLLRACLRSPLNTDENRRLG